MKKIFIGVMLLMILLFTALTSYAAFGIKLYVDGVELNCDVPPRIINNRTMVPARVVFESLDAEVEWNEKKRQVTITSGETIIILNIGAKRATVNGKRETLDTAPVILHDRTFIPIRFVSETLGYDVSWNDTAKSVSITSPLAPEKEYVSDVVAVDTYDEQYSTSIEVKLTKGVTPKVFTLNEPFRIVVDFYDTSLSTKDGRLPMENIYINEVRWALHEDFSRIVVETNGEQPFEISGGGTKKFIIRVGNENSIIPGADDEPEAESKPVQGDKTESDDKDKTQEKEDESVEIPAYEDMIVVLDAGHGGSDPGAVAQDRGGNILVDKNGKYVLQEKDVNLKIALGIRDELKKQGVKVLMIRDDDLKKNPSMDKLSNRCDYANKMGATLFLSVHNNAAASPDATGTEVCYTEASDGSYGVTSKQFANNVLPLLVEATGLRNRGIVNRPNLYVLKYTDMPAILLECGFLTCETDREVLMDDDKLDEISKAVAKGIIKTLKQIDSNR